MLNKKIYKKGIKEILNFKNIKKNPKNLKEQILNIYGSTFFKEILNPIINKKSFNCSLDKIEPNNHFFFWFFTNKSF